MALSDGLEAAGIPTPSQEYNDKSHKCLQLTFRRLTLFVFLVPADERKMLRDLLCSQ